MLDILNQINWAVLAPFLVINGILILVALIDWFKRERLNGPKWLWLIIILFVSTFGPIIYFIFGRKSDE